MEYIRSLNFQAHLPCEALEVAMLDYANSNFARGSSLQLPRRIFPSLFLSRFYALRLSFVQSVDLLSTLHHSPPFPLSSIHTAYRTSYIQSTFIFVPSRCIRVNF